MTMPCDDVTLRVEAQALLALEPAFAPVVVELRARRSWYGAGAAVAATGGVFTRCAEPGRRWR
jgi:hypothetical protein